MLHTYPTERGHAGHVARAVSAARIFAVVAALTILAATPANAQYILANINQSAASGFNDCASVAGTQFGPCDGLLYAGQPVAVDQGFARASTDFGVNKVAVGGTGSASSEWLVSYGLTGGTPGSTVNLDVSFAYDVTLAAGSNQAEFRMVLNNETLSPFIIRHATNGLGDLCNDRAPDQQVGCGAGNHNGTFFRSITASINPNNRLAFFVGASVFGTGEVDAFDTVTIESIVVPDDIEWHYNGLSGNPLNFRHATTQAVPAPFAVELLAMGLAGLAAIRRLRRRV